jgi:hypothetical protein
VENVPDPDERELISIEDAIVFKCDYFAAQKMSDEAITRTLLNTEDKFRQFKEDNKKEPKLHNEKNPFNTAITDRMPGFIAGDLVDIKNQNINDWRRIISTDDEVRNNLSIIPRLTSEHFKLIKKRGTASLDKLNKEILRLFGPKIIHSLTPGRCTDNLWMDKLMEYITYLFQKHLLELLPRKDKKPDNRKSRRDKKLKTIRLEREQNMKLKGS